MGSIYQSSSVGDGSNEEPCFPLLDYHLADEAIQLIGKCFDMVASPCDMGCECGILRKLFVKLA